jgi:hypothetical protein
MRPCSQCGEVLSVEFFTKAPQVKSGVRAYCKMCARKYEKPRLPYMQNTRKQALEAYGGRCVECGLDDLDMLCLDHIHNDGAVYRKLYRGTTEGWAKKNNYPPNVLQVLCHNHNMKKEANRRRGVKK